MSSRPGQPGSVQPAESGNTAGEGRLRGGPSSQHQPTRTDEAYGQHFARRCCGSVDAQRQPGPVSEQREAAGAYPGRLFMPVPTRLADGVGGRLQYVIFAPVVFSIGERLVPARKG